MSFTSDSYSNIGVPRVYCDVIQYVRQLGMIDLIYEDTSRLVPNDSLAMWDMNPCNVAHHIISGEDTSGAIQFNARLEDTDDPYENLHLRYLFMNCNYGALLGHNISQSDTHRYVESRLKEGHAIHSEILGEKKCRSSLGTNMWKIDRFHSGTLDLSDPQYARQIGFKINQGTGGQEWEPGEIIKIGAFSTGRFMDLPHNAEISSSTGFDFSGVLRQKTISGDTLTRIKYKRPKWGDFSPFTNISLTYGEQDLQNKLENNNFYDVSMQGRRTWNLSFKFISKEDMFPKIFGKSMVGDYETASGTPTFDADDSILSTWAQLTFGFSLNFIFQPDNTKLDFAMVKGDKSSIKITQDTPTSYTFKIKLIEQF